MFDVVEVGPGCCATVLAYNDRGCWLPRLFCPPDGAKIISPVLKDLTKEQNTFTLLVGPA